MSSPSKPVSAVARGTGLSANKQRAKGATLAVMAFSASLSNGSETHFNAHWATLHCQVGFPLRPAAHIEQDLIYLRDGRLVTAAGVTAGIDLALALVGQQHGPDVALKVAKRLVVVAQRQGGQSQFSPYLTATADPASPIARTQDYVRSNLVGRHTLKFLAAEVGMSSRNLARHFVQEAGITPHEFVERARIDAARMLLEGSDRALKAVAHDCGFGTADRMRIVFSERLGVTPAQYRASFRRADA
jgi:transcriptional regulator GlxA family with amidase domain